MKIFVILVVLGFLAASVQCADVVCERCRSTCRGACTIMTGTLCKKVCFIHVCVRYSLLCTIGLQRLPANISLELVALLSSLF